MEKKYEVEYRALIAKEVFDNLLNKGKEQDGFEGPIEIRDFYFCPKNVRSFNEIEMDKIGSYSLRLRKKKRNGVEEKIDLNTKIIKNEGDHNAWLEHEISVSSFEETSRILEAIGFKIFLDLKKSRYSFFDKEVHVFLEDIENFQPAIELEILTTKENTEKSKKILLEYFKKNGISKESIVEKSITNILMSERSKF